MERIRSVAAQKRKIRGEEEKQRQEELRIIREKQRKEELEKELEEIREEERECEYIAPKVKPEETCFDGIKNQNEEGIDCGGVCKPCVELPAPKKVPLMKAFLIGWLIILFVIILERISKINKK